MTAKESGRPNHEGGCACGEVRYQYDGEPIFTVHCHCRDCQRSSGSGAATLMGIAAADFNLLRGTPRSYAYRGDSGQYVRRYFCTNCGAPLFSEADGFPDVRFVRAVSLDDPSWVKPSAHIYCASAQPWDRAADDLARFEYMPT
ncbi:GFA family protein [Solimonas soli]|uniref:GFA family protein n=1 Tax=Solimonas soli TaxID=413479 RepID=UPI00068594AE|nr:GFA family protein [Solimonas soli]